MKIKKVKKLPVKRDSKKEFISTLTELERKRLAVEGELLRRKLGSYRLAAEQMGFTEWAVYHWVRKYQDYVQDYISSLEKHGELEEQGATDTTLGKPLVTVQDLSKPQENPKKIFPLDPYSRPNFRRVQHTFKHGEFVKHTITIDYQEAAENPFGFPKDDGIPSYARNACHKDK
jgi:hypothetical protein